jgi:hypothetical protein
MMPNWCENSLRATGPTGEIHRFLEKAEGCGVAWPKDPAVATVERERRKLLLDFNKFVPMPDDVKIAGTLDWCCLHWGTRWNADERTKVERLSDCEVRFDFDTAWDPPDLVVIAMAEQFPCLKLELIYGDDFAGFEGMLICEHGALVFDDRYPSPGLQDPPHWDVGEDDGPAPVTEDVPEVTGDSSAADGEIREGSQHVE